MSDWLYNNYNNGWIAFISATCVITRDISYLLFIFIITTKHAYINSGLRIESNSKTILFMVRIITTAALLIWIIVFSIWIIIFRIFFFVFLEHSLQCFDYPRSQFGSLFALNLRFFTPTSSFQCIYGPCKMRAYMVCRVLK